ncbi:MAG: pilus assembly protein TadG-related protein, partial [Chloroflexota bacterium]|nr:pilus assembly protein TadG-related protein [Chloroflexota bacterium]
MDPRQERPSTAIRAALRGEDGQIMPVLMVTLIALVLVGTLLFQVARGSDQRARAQTAADA